MGKIVEEQSFIACLHCDALVAKPTVRAGEKLFCRQCGSLLLERKFNSVDRTLAVSLAGVILLFPAISLSLIGIGAVGLFNQSSLLKCISILIDEGAYVVAGGVFLFAVIIPAIRLLAALYLSYCLKFKIMNRSLLVFFRFYRQLDSWSMLHVFFLGIVVSMYKLFHLADLSLGLGLYSFVLLLICSTLVSVTLDQNFVWETLGNNLASKNNKERAFVLNS